MNNTIIEFYAKEAEMKELKNEITDLKAEKYKLGRNVENLKTRLQRKRKPLYLVAMISFAIGIILGTILTL